MLLWKYGAGSGLCESIQVFVLMLDRHDDTEEVVEGVGLVSGEVKVSSGAGMFQPARQPWTMARGTAF